MKKAVRRVGRPAKPAAERKRNNLTFRANDSLRKALVRSAAKNQRSISEEIEHRLLSSFEKDDWANFARDALRESLETGQALPVKIGEWMRDLEKADPARPPESDASSQTSAWESVKASQADGPEPKVPVATVSKTGTLFSDDLYEEGLSRLSPEERKTVHMRRIVRDMKWLIGELNDLANVQPNTKKGA